MPTAAMPMLRRAAPVAAAALLLVGVFLAARQQPRFTWQNTGVLIEYPPAAAVGAVLAGCGAALAAFALRGIARKIAGVIAVVALLIAAQLALYSVAIENAGLRERGLFGSSVLAWRDVARVESGTRLVVVWGRDERQVRINASVFGPEDRAQLDRTIARRVRESTARP